MRRKTLNFLGSFIALLLAPAFVFADELPPVPQPIDPSTITFPDTPVRAPAPEVAPPAFLDAIARAKKMLGEELALIQAAEIKPTVIWSKDNFMDITLAIWDQKTDTIHPLKAKKNGVKLQFNDQPEFKIKVTSNNGANSQYEISDPQKFVVGVIYPILKEVTVKKRKGYELHSVVYVPNNKAFYRPEILAAGSDYLSFLVRDAFDDLRAKQIRSVSYSGKLLADTIDPYLVKSIIVIEHSDSRIYGDNEPERAVGAFLVSLALNQDDAFNLSVSSAGARGLVQFIPSTYSLLVKRLPKLELIADFNTGMADHRNAIKAQAALLDNDLASMPSSIKAEYAVNNQTASTYLAAAYNGGAVRVKKALELWGPLWSKSHGPEKDALIDHIERLKSDVKLLNKKITKTKDAKEVKKMKAQVTKDENDIATGRAELAKMKAGSLYIETAQYVEKLQRVYTMFSAGFFATPNAPTGALPDQPKVLASN